MSKTNSRSNDEDIYLGLKLFILKQIKNERELTQNKINLLLKYSQRQTFNFLLSKDNSEIETEKDFISFKSVINKFKTLNENDINLIIQIYDKDNDLLLNYKEFYYFISPKYIDTNIDELRAKNKNENNSNDEPLSKLGQNVLYNIFKLEINNLKELSFIMQNIISNFAVIDDNIYIYLFQMIKGVGEKCDYKNEYILISDIIKFINKDGKNDNTKIYEQDIANFIFRFDYDNDLKLSFNEFANMINYFLNANINAKVANNNNDNNINENENKNDNRNKGKLFYDYSSLNIDITNGSQFNTLNKFEDPSFDLSKHAEEKIQNEQAKIINENRQNSFINNVSVTFNDLDDVLTSMFNKNNNNPNGIDINSVINYKTRDLQDMKISLLIEYFKILIDELSSVELNKQKLAKEFNINLKNLFNLFDCNDEGNISYNNFVLVFDKYFHKQFQEKDILFLIKKYDKNKDNKLNYNEFSNMILPTSTEYRKILENNSSNIEKVNEYNEKEMKIIVDLFMALIKCEEMMQNQKIKICNVPLFTNYEMFEFIRNKENKLLTSLDIMYFLKSNNILIINEQLDVLLNYLFFSIEKSKKYGFKEFIRILQPL